MTYSPDDDSEDLADLRLRAETERDPNRMREPPVWNPPKFIGKIPCRARCGRLADWTAEAEQAFETFNRILAARNEPPIDKTRVMFCDACRATERALSADSNRKQVDDLADKIRQLKASQSPGNEHDLITQIRRLGHPDVDGLVKAIQDKLDSRPARNRVRVEDVR